MRTTVGFWLLGFAAVALQRSLVPQLSIGGVTADLVVVSVIAVAVALGGAVVSGLIALRLARRRTRIVPGIAALIIRLRRSRRRRGRDRPARLTPDIARRPKAFVGKSETADVFAERRHFQRIFRAAHARP